MNNYGFFIKKLELRDKQSNIDSKSIEFNKGLNVIYGSSDTGKTFIFQCINFMLGSSSIPKEIPESKPYNICRLDIETYENEKFTLERSLQGGDFNLYDENGTFLRDLNEKNNKKVDKETISDFLLGLCNILGKEIRKNNSGAKQNLYFQDILKYFLINEEKIITENSIISERPERGFNASMTFEKNVLRFLISGVDDSTIIESSKKNSVEFKKGKIELYNELIEQLSDELKDTNYEEIDEQIKRLDDTIKNFKDDYSKSKIELNKYDEEKNELKKEISSQESFLISNNELLTRSNLLKQQYLSDIERLKATLEAGMYLDNIESKECPVCNSEPKSNINIPELAIATQAEILKIELLLKELQSSQNIYLKEYESYKNGIETNQERLDKVVKSIQGELKDVLEDISKKIKEYSDKKQELSRVKTLKVKLESYENKKALLNVKEKKTATVESQFSELTVSIMDTIIKKIETFLKDINFDNPSNPHISYTEELLDFVVSSKNRKDYGKGYRAILYASFVIALLQYFKDKTYQIGCLVIDSPLNPYKPDEKKDDGIIPNNLAHNFYKYLHENIIDEQIILIENTSLQTELKDKVTNYEFSRDNGFLPTLDN